MKSKTKFSVLIYFIGLLLVSGMVNMVFADVPEVQRNALIALYNSTNGDGWIIKDNWTIESSPVNTWYGVICEVVNQLEVVREVNLDDNNLSGTLPAQLGDLSNLTHLRLALNQLGGNIPAELGNLNNLMVLDLHANQLTGIPAELAQLTNLTHLYLNRNRLTGTIPADLGGLTNLEVLALHANHLNGSIPPEPGGLSNLVLLYLHDNRLTGNIPSQLGGLSSLTNLTLNGNRLAGNIPSNIGNLTGLESNGSDFRWNALYTGSVELRDFINTKQREGNWENTQTIAPIGVTATAIDSSSVRVSWSSIDYRDDPGGYLVYYGTTSGGPYELYQTTADKTVSQVDVKDLTRGTLYYFVVQTQTGAHADNNNPLESEYSMEVSEIPSGEIALSGTVSTTGDQGVPGVTLTFSNNGGTTITDAHGHYKQVIDIGWSGTGVPTKAGYTFTPVQRGYSDVQSSFLDQDYVASINVLEISGRITSQQGGIGIPGVTLTFSDIEEPVVTDHNGYYKGTVPYGWTGEVRPAKTGFEFTPSRFFYTDVTTDRPGQDFIGQAVMPVISGKVISPAGGGLADVALTFSNGGGTTYTGADGRYIQAVNNGWSGTVTPYKRGYGFSPPYKTYTDVQADHLDQDYTASEIFTEISGRVEISDETEEWLKTGMGLSGVVLTFSNDGGSTITDSNGDYSHQVDYGWSGEVTPSRPGYNFRPKKREYDPVTTDLPGQNFEARKDLLTISGTITISTAQGSKDLADVALEFSSNGGTAYTDDNGYYIRPVRTGWSGTVTPSKSGYTFTDTSHQYNDVERSYANQNFSAAHANPRISGTVRKADGTPVQDVTLTFSTNEGIEGVTNTNSGGYYRYAVKYGISGWTGRVTPSKPGFSFVPPHNDYTELQHNITADYTCIPDVILTLQASRVKETTLAVSKYYGKIDLTVQITGDISILTYRIYRKTNDSHYRVIKDIPAAEIQNGTTYTYNDPQYLEKDTTYTYKTEAFNDLGEVIAESNEVTI